jgi:hypothetical protein
MPRRIQLANFHDNDPIIMPHAKRLATDFMRIMKPQIRQLGVKKPSHHSDADTFWAGCRREAERMFFQALRVHGLMKAAPHYYTYEWHSYGDDVSRDTMSDEQGSDGPRDEKRTVTWCLTPTVHMWEIEDHSRGRHFIANHGHIMSREKH